MQPLISIIIPIYNVEPYLDRCVQSVLKQTLKDIEIILVDDGSPDNCPAMCDEYAKQDNRIKVIHKKNAGLGYARNSGLDIALGKYIAFLDSDDFVDSRMYQILYETAHQDNLDTCYCSFIRHDTNGRNEKKTEAETYIRFRGETEISSFLLDMIGPDPSYHSDVKYMMCVWKAIYSKEVIDAHKIRFCSERQLVSEDILFHLDYLPYARNIGFIPNHLYYYCINGVATLSNTYSREKFEKNKLFLAEVRRRLTSLFPISKFINRYYRLCFLYLRTSISKELKSLGQRTLKEKKECIKELISDPLFKEMLLKYPYRKLPLKHQTIFFLMKYKCYTILALALTK